MFFLMRNEGFFRLHFHWTDDKVKFSAPALYGSYKSSENRNKVYLKEKVDKFDFNVEHNCL